MDRAKGQNNQTELFDRGGGNIPLQTNSCRECWKEMQGQYIVRPVWVVLPSDEKHPKERYKMLGYRAQCHKCGAVRWYDSRGALFRLNGNLPDFNAQFWPCTKLYNLDPQRLQDFIYQNRQTSYFNLADLPRAPRPAPAESLHREEFYEPKGAARQ